MSNTYNYIRRSPKEKLNILTFPTHERYEQSLFQTGHNFYSFEYFGKLDTKADNCFGIPKDKFYPNSGFDLILAQSRFGQFKLAEHINESLKIPIITVEHTVPTPDLTEKDRHAMGSMNGDVNVFINQFQLESWSQYGRFSNANIIEHCVDTEIFFPGYWPDGILTVANKFQDRDYCLNYKLWKEVFDSNEFYMRVVGADSNKINSMFKEYDDVGKLSNEYRNCEVYLNTTSHSTIPTSLLEAMACGCPVVSTSTCGIPEVITDGENGLLADNAKDIIRAIKRIQDDKELAKRLGENARATIVDRFSKTRFIKEWNEIFMKTYEASL